MFLGLWRIVKQFNTPLHDSLKDIGTYEYPHTISFIMRKRLQLDNFGELPKDKQPPREIWDKPKALEEWFDRVYENKQTTFDFEVDDKEVES